MARKRVKRTDCPNCGRSLLTEDNYCPSCGQENHTHKLPVRHFIVELLGGLFNFDTKLIRTLRDLFWPPGLVIREFNANKRARYVHPLRLYLFTSVVFFLLLAWATNKLDQGEQHMVEIKARDVSDEADQGLTLNFGDGQDLSDSTLQALAARPQLSDAALDSTMAANGITSGFWERVLTRITMNLSTSANANRKAAYIQNMFGAFSKLMFLLLPLFAFLLFLMHLGSGRFYSEHLIFALYYHSVLFVLITLSLLASEFLVFSIGPVNFLALALIYLTGAMRTVLRGSWSVTVLKAIALVLFYSVFLVLGFSAALVIGAL